MAKAGAPLSQLMREAVTSLASGRAAALTVIMCSAVCIWVASYYEARSVEATQDTHEQLNKDGGFLYSVSVPELGSRALSRPLSRGACERLDRLPGVAGAGSVDDSVTVRTVAAPQEWLEVATITPGLFDVVSTYVQTLSYSPQEFLAEPSRIADVGSSAGLAVRDLGVRPVNATRLRTLSPGYARVVFEVGAPAGPTESCLVALEPRALHVAQALPAALGRPDLVVRRVLAGAELIPSPLETHRDRQTRHLWWGGSLLAAAAFRFVLWTRRGDMSVYRMFGVASFDARLILVIELVLGCSVGAALGAVAARLSLIGFAPLSIRFGWYGSALAYLGLLLATAIVPLTLRSRDRDLMAALKDR